ERPGVRSAFHLHRLAGHRKPRRLDRRAVDEPARGPRQRRAGGAGGGDVAHGAHRGRHPAPHPGAGPRKPVARRRCAGGRLGGGGGGGAAAGEVPVHAGGV
ncbi:MAG: hypothetical protein AVDCRST_MAG68-4708, partial [uncultured Gemmatimonadetes bacterium]